MRISTDQETFQRGLTVVARAVAARSTLPQTSHICMATDGGRLKLAATNLEIAITSWITAEVEEDGSITIPARLLTEFVALLPEAPISVSVAPRSRQAQIVCARNEATISGMDADDFPPIPSISDGDVIRLEPASLREAIEHVVFAAATDDSRPVLTGVHPQDRGGLSHSRCRGRLSAGRLPHGHCGDACRDDRGDRARPRAARVEPAPHRP